MKIVQDDTTGTVWIGQPAYTEALLKKFEMDQAKVSATPVDSSNKLVKASEGDNAFDQHMYQSAVGSLLYLSVATRPDIVYAVSNVVKFSANPTTQHWTAVKRIMRYLRVQPILVSYLLCKGNVIAWDFLMLTGLVILTTGSPHPDMFSKLVEAL